MKPQLLPADVDAALGMMPDPSLHRELLEVARSTLEGADLAAPAALENLDCDRIGLEHPLRRQ